jgi:hypothetical protein
MTFGLGRVGRRLGSGASENAEQVALTNVQYVLDQAIATTRTLVAGAGDRPVDDREADRAAAMLDAGDWAGLCRQDRWC